MLEKVNGCDVTPSLTRNKFWLRKQGVYSTYILTLLRTRGIGMHKYIRIKPVSLSFFLCVGMLFLCAPAVANAGNYDADITSVDFEDVEDDVTGDEYSIVIIETESTGNFIGHLVMYFEIVDENDNKYFVSLDQSKRGYDYDGSGSDSYEEGFRFEGVGECDVIAYWIGWYHGEKGDETLLFDSVNKKVKDLLKWKEKVASYPQVELEHLSRAIWDDNY
jgi:hypothetical protein